MAVLVVVGLILELAAFQPPEVVIHHQHLPHKVIMGAQGP
jgi:hypothetical protein